MGNVRLIDADELRNAPELPLGLPPLGPLSGPGPRDLPLPVTQVDLDAAEALVTVLDAVAPQHRARLIRAMVAHYELVDLW